MQQLAQAFFDNGFITFNFDATNSFGESDGEFEKATLQLHYEDLEDVVIWAKEQAWYTGKLALTGHSMGGYTVARYGEEYSDQVDYIASIAPVVSGELSWQAHRRAYPGQLEEWKESGWLIRESKSRPGTFMRRPWSHMEERLNHDLLPKAKNLTMPIFFYVGGGDKLCPSDQTQILFDKVPGDNKEIIMNPEVGHVYRTDGEIEHLYQSVNRWIKNQLLRKVILVDAVNTFVDKETGMFQEMYELLEQYSNKKIVLTNADDEQMEKFGLNDLPYEVFTLKHNPNKPDPVYFETMLKNFDLKADEVIYFEHNEGAVRSAQSVGITTYHYNSVQKDLDLLQSFLNQNI